MDEQQLKLIMAALGSLNAVPGSGGQGWQSTQVPGMQPGDLGLQKVPQPDGGVDIGPPGSNTNPIEARPDLAQAAEVINQGGTPPGFSELQNPNAPAPVQLPGAGMVSGLGGGVAPPPVIEPVKPQQSPQLAQMAKMSMGKVPVESDGAPKNLDQVNSLLFKNAKSSADAMARQAETESTVQLGLAEAAKNTRTELQNIAGEQQKFAQDMQQQLKSVALEAGDLAKQKIEPGRVFRESGAFGSLIAFGTTFMSGYLGTKYGKPNEVANQISAIINRDIESQMFDINNQGKNLDRKTNLISMEMANGRSDFEARTLASITAHKLVADELVANGTAMGAKDKAVQLGNAIMTNALKEAGDNYKVKMQVGAQYAQIKNAKEMNTLNNLVSIGNNIQDNSMKLLQMTMAADQKSKAKGPIEIPGLNATQLGDRTVSLGDKNIGVANREGDASALQKKLSATDRGLTIIKDIRDYIDRHGTAFTTGSRDVDKFLQGETGRTLMTKFGELANVTRELSDMKALNGPGEYAIALAQSGQDPTKLFGVIGPSAESMRAVYRSLANDLIRNGNQAYRQGVRPDWSAQAYGIDTSKYTPFKDEAKILEETPGISSGVPARKNPNQQLIDMLQNTNPFR